MPRALWKGGGAQSKGRAKATPSLTFAIWQVSKTVSKADDSIEAARWWLGHIFVQSHPVGFLNDWGPGRGDQAGTLGPPVPISTKCSSASVSPQETHRDSTSS